MEVSKNYISVAKRFGITARQELDRDVAPDLLILFDLPPATMMFSVLLPLIFFNSVFCFWLPRCFLRL